MPSLQFQSQVAEQADAASRQLVAPNYSAISSNPKTVSVVSKLQFTHASRSSHSWLSKQPRLVQSSKLVVASQLTKSQWVASLSWSELGTAQPQLFSQLFCSGTWFHIFLYLLSCIHFSIMFKPVFMFAVFASFLQIYWPPKIIRKGTFQPRSISFFS